MMILLGIFELLGLIACAISGALVGIQKGMDLFGVAFLAVTTAVGGGIFRDVLIGNIPPIALHNPFYCLVAVCTALVVATFCKRIVRLKNTIAFFDAIGLGVFTGLGSKAAIMHGLNEPFIIISMGLVTGIGGGILRDVFAQQIPFVFRKEIYALNCILGSLAFYFSYDHFPLIVSLYACFFVTFIARIICLKYDLSLPPLRKKQMLDY